MKRRYFLQTTALSAIYLAQAEQYRQVLARSSSRKLALLVGINSYSETRDRSLSPLNGCKTDVELQRELLIHRFGFKPSDIKILLNEDATRSNILQTFETHLIQQANSDDIVVFHFSGHGSRVFDSEAITSDQANTAFVPAASNHLNPDQSVNDIMGKTLFLLMSALKTENVTAVFDCCYSGGGTRGSERVRADASNMLYQPSKVEIDYQKSWMRKLGLTPEQLRARRKKGAKGAILAAATANQLAKENDLADVSSGLFTYFLTQYLWESAESLTDAEAMIERSLFAATGFQEPVFDVRPELTTKPIYFTAPIHRSAQSVVQSVQRNQATLWLGGLDKRTLESFGTGSTFSTLEGTETVTIIERKGLTAIAKIPSKLRPGTLLKESARVIPRTIKLRIGLDSPFGDQAPKIESDRIEFVPTQNGAYPQFVQYILSRATSNSIGLFSPSLERLPDSFGQADESISDAIVRLTPRFQSLFAAHLIRQTLNPTASQLNIEVSLHRQNQPDQIIAQSSTNRSSNLRNQPIPVKTPCQFQIKNHDRSSLYLLIALISPNGRFSIIFPNDYISGDLSGEVPAKANRLVPDPEQGEAFKISPPLVGRGEALIVASRSPLTRTYKQLRTLAEESNRMPIAITTQRGIDAIENLLSDLDRQSGHSTYKISTEDVATLSLAFQII